MSPVLVINNIPPPPSGQDLTLLDRFLDITIRDKYLGITFLDTLSLIKIDDQWSIYNKLFNVEE